MIFPITALWMRLKVTRRSRVIFMLRNRACLSALLVQHYPALSVPPDWEN
jgi:hypothetical protein